MSFVGKNICVHIICKMLVLLMTGTAVVMVLPGSANAVVTDTTSTSEPKSLTQSEINTKIETIAKAKGIPNVLLKAIAYKESCWRQWDADGNPLLSQSEYPAIGIMQISSKYITDEAILQKLKEDIDFNIATGADLLNEKWKMVPRIGDGNRNILENWYFVLWAYNKWTEGNNPRFLANSDNGAEASIVTEVEIPIAYQEKILTICANPPGFLARYIKPVEITGIETSFLPATGVPTAGSCWDTPLPIHYGNLSDALDLKRISGSDRIDTANCQAFVGWPEGAPAVVLARADAFPDALAGVPLAAQLNAPVLLTGSQSLDDRVADAIVELNPDKIYLLGGEGALSSKVSNSLTQLGWGSARQERIFGADRYTTAAAIAVKTVELSSNGDMDSRCEAVVLATGENFPDALSIAAVAGANKMPVLLTTKTGLPQAASSVLKQINPEKVYLIGGTGVIAPAVATGVQTLLGMDQNQIIRLAGSDRYLTATAVLQYFAADPGSLAFATGEDFPDALAGAALATKTGAKLVLLPPGSLQFYPELRDYLVNCWPGLSTATIYGGTGAVSAAKEQELRLLGE